MASSSSSSSSFCHTLQGSPSALINQFLASFLLYVNRSTVSNRQLEACSRHLGSCALNATDGEHPETSDGCCTVIIHNYMQTLQGVGFFLVFFIFFTLRIKTSRLSVDTNPFCLPSCSWCLSRLHIQHQTFASTFCPFSFNLMLLCQEVDQVFPPFSSHSALKQLDASAKMCDARVGLSIISFTRPKNPGIKLHQHVSGLQLWLRQIISTSKYMF